MPDGRGDVGSRIRELRERAGILSQDLAQQVGLDPSAMSNIESGKRSVKTDELVRIAAALDVSPVAILDEDSLLGRLAIAPRAAVGTYMPKPAYARLTALAELHDVLRSEGLPATPNLGDVTSVDGVPWLKASEQLAGWARRRLRLTEIGEHRFAALVEAIEDELVVDVMVDDIEGDGLAGASLTDPEFPLIFINVGQPRSRALFTLAHELGHVLAPTGSIAVDDLIDRGDENEKLANAFAASFLMPEQEIRDQLEKTGQTIGTIAVLMDRLGVSFESLMWRLQNLRIMSPAQSQGLRRMGVRRVLWDVDDKQLSKRILGRLGTSPERRPPGWLAARAYNGFKRGAISIRPLAQLLGADPDELLDRLSSGDPNTEAVVVSAIPSDGPAASDDERFAGDPVEPASPPADALN